MVPPPSSISTLELMADIWLARAGQMTVTAEKKKKQPPNKRQSTDQGEEEAGSTLSGRWFGIQSELSEHLSKGKGPV